MEHNNSLKSLLAPYRALDLTDRNGYFCSKILADLGARIIRLEKPGMERDFWWWAYNRDKELEYLDIEKDKTKVLALAREADFVIESFKPGYLKELGLGYTDLQKVNPGLVLTSITPFGQTGPYKDFKASDLEIMASSGVMYLLGDNDRPPVRIGFPQSFLLASAYAAVGTLIAHHWRLATGEGQHVDTSAQESLFDVLMNAMFFYTWQGMNPVRNGKYRFGVSGGMFLHPLVWKCKDGHVSYLLQAGKLGAHSNSTIARYIDSEGMLTDFLRNVDWDNLVLSDKNPEQMAAFWQPFADFFSRHTTKEIYQISLKERAQIFPVNTVKDSLDDEQLNARDFWQEQTIPELTKKVLLPGSFAKISVQSESSQVPDSTRNEKKPKNLPFDGLKVADFSWVATGPWITRWLAAYGAEVIKIESAHRLDANRIAGPNKDDMPGPNRSAYFLVYNGGKKSATLNLNNPEGRELAKGLVKWADIVVESFAPGQMKKWGLSYDELREINPRMIMLSASMMGATGPHSRQPGLGMLMTSLVGFTSVTGWPDRDPVFIWGAYTDVPTSRIGASVLLSAMDFTQRSGRGCYIDLAQYEASLQFLTPLILEYQITGNLRHRMGNSSAEATPHGVFPCKGDDRWCTISVYSESEWASFCKAIGSPEWARNPKFATFEQRKKNEDELERYISDWTSLYPPEQVMTQLQQSGIHACAVNNCGDLYHDPQLRHRNHFITVNHPEIGDYDYFCPGFRLDKVPITARRDPCLGEHTEQVCKEILGLSDEEYRKYLASGALE
jgi:crotonobetainyl-CoA:carnitine CoA-transferase CaiB-like acyl-CoA transferase